MKQKIINFFQDKHQDWTVNLYCGHNQHMRHNPPWQNRAWVLNANTRAEKIGTKLECLLCNDVAKRDVEKNDVAKRDVEKNDVAKMDVTKMYVAKRDVAKMEFQ